MEEYLQYMKTLRSHINDAEDLAANISADEQVQFTTIQTLQNDIVSAKSIKKQLKGDAEKLLTAKGQLCSLIIEKQRKIASLDSDSSTLTQCLLLQCGRGTFFPIAATTGNHSVGNCLIPNNENNEEANDLIVKLDSEKAKLDEILHMKAKLLRDNDKLKESIEQAKHGANHLKPELLEISITTLEEEYKALLSDKDGETEYLCSLKDQVEQIKGISQVINCACGKEYMLDLRA